MAQEKMDSWWEYARELAKAERELKIEKWVYISIEYKEENGERVVLYHYDLPRELHERYRWVIRWREAKLLCQYPKKNIHTYYSYYDKRTGLNTDFNSLLSKLTSAKAQITIAERKEQEYLQYQRQNNLFFNEPKIRNYHPIHGQNLNCHSLYLRIRCYQNSLQKPVLTMKNSQKRGSTA